MLPLPIELEYRAFIEELRTNLNEQHPDVCFYTFGSINNGSCNWGRSDIDGGLILSSGVITDKVKILEIADILAVALSKNRVGTQFNLLDRETCIDGRFLSYTKDYTDFLKQRAKIHTGPNFVAEMNGIDFKSGVLSSAAFNFSGPGGVRNALLNSLDYVNSSNELFSERMQKALEKVAKFPKKLVWLREGEIIPERESSHKRLKNLLPGLDSELLYRVNSLLNNPGVLYQTLEDKEETIGLVSDALNCMESIIGEYTTRFFPNEREFKK